MARTDKTWLAHYALCAGVLTTMIDSSIVAVALPSISRNLRLTDSSLSWLMNTYMLAFSSFLLLSGRLSDLYGKRLMFLAGSASFTLASLLCGLSDTLPTLLAARALQGLAAAVVGAVSLSLIANLFPDHTTRAKAMGIYGLVCAAGGSAGNVLGGLLTQFLSWHWIFLINVPVGICVTLLCAALLPQDEICVKDRRLDVSGAVSVTAASTLCVYAITNVSEQGWTSFSTQCTLGVGILLGIVFVIREFHVEAPLVPLRLAKLRQFSVGNLLGVLWSAGVYGWSVIVALYLQRVQGYDPLEIGISFLPSTVVVGAFSAGLSAKVVLRYGARAPLSIGLFLAAIGLALLARSPPHGPFYENVLPAMLLEGLGSGMASAPLLLATLKDVDRQDTGVASGIINTSFVVGGALGLAALIGFAGVHTGNLIRSGSAYPLALYEGYRMAFLAGALLTVVAALLAAVLLDPELRPQRSVDQLG